MIEQPQQGLVIVSANLEQVLIPEILSVIVDCIDKGTVVIVKGAIASRSALALRDQIVHWRNRQAVVDFATNTNSPDLNFHRIDAAPEKSLLPHLFHQHGFGKLGDIDVELKQHLLAVAQPMLRLQNLVAKTSFSFDMPEVRIKALQYPSGGGFLMKHTHPIQPQGVGLILALSKSGVDFKEGGTTFVTPQGFVDTSPWHDAGDLILFRYDLEHAVGPIDSGVDLNWDSEKGRWTLVLELLSTHRRSEAA